MTTTVLVAGATGMLGSRIAAHLLDQPDTSVRLLVRPGSLADPARAASVAALTARGATVVDGDLTVASTLNSATAGVDVVVSAVQGSEDVVLDGQVALARAAAANGVRRFLPSDFALDLFAAPEGAPMFELRRQADAVIDELPMEAVHVLNGAFMDMMLDPSTAGIIDLTAGTGTLFGTGDEPFDLTTLDDTARFTAHAAVDPGPLPRVLRLSGSRTSLREIVRETERLTGTSLTTSVMASIEDLRRTVDEAHDPWSVVRQWYLLSMLTTPPFADVDNDRYADATPTSLTAYLEQAHRAMTAV